MNNINITISAPELVEAMQALTAALAVGTVKPAQVEADKPSKEKKEPKSEPKTEVEAPATVATETNVTVTLEDVRGKLATLSQTGKAKEVKQLIASYGVTRLTDIDSGLFNELLEKAEAL